MGSLKKEYKWLIDIYRDLSQKKKKKIDIYRDSLDLELHTMLIKFFFLNKMFISLSPLNMELVSN